MAAPQPDGRPEPHPTGSGAEPGSLDLQLYDALKRGDLAAARAALAAGADAAAQLEFEVPHLGVWPPRHYGFLMFGPDGQELEPEEEKSNVDRSMLWAAALGDCATAVQLLLDAGARVQLRDINQAIEAGSLGVLAALLAAAHPRPPSGDIEIELEWPEPESACPLWSALRWAGKHGLRHSAAMVEVLLAAGYQPAKYKEAQETNGDEIYELDNFCPARVWGKGQGKKFEFLTWWLGAPEDGRLAPLWELICAGRRSWSPKRHSRMPPAFKAAARALLLAAHRIAGSGAKEHAAASLGALPPAALLNVLRLAAAPVSAWVALGE